jgi:ubiquinone/menaquinone biosynthesis C-methylase UbiE/uncharacterized protein YbaR (Trm112 family)
MGDALVTEFAPGLHARTGVDVDSSAYERYLGRWSRPFVPSVIAAAGVRAGSKVLDISTGTGEAAVGLLPVIGPSGLVVGADISPEMVRSAIQRVDDTRFQPVAADGQALPFRGGCFDAVVCQLGLQFFPDPALGLSEFRRVLRRGGKAAVCVISYPDRAPMWGFLAEAIARHLPQKRDLLLASFSLADPRRVADLFSQAGFTNVSVRHETRGGIVQSLDEYWEPIQTGVGSIPQSWLMLEEDQRREVRDDVNARLARFAVGGELHLSVEMLICHGEAGAAGIEEGAAVESVPASIDSRLGGVLACPKTKGALRYDAATNELVSRGAGLAYPIRDGIPIMLLSEARPVDLP